MRRDYFPAFARLSILLISTAVLLVSGCGTDGQELPTLRTDASFRKDGALSFLTAAGDTVTTIDIEIAETNQSRAQGMKGRRSLPPQSGMFFIMDDVDTSGFWMQDTPLPLDIMFVGPDSVIINVVERTTPYSEAIIRPEAPKKYVVEVRAGFSDRMGIRDSLRIAWNRTEPPAS